MCLGLRLLRMGEQFTKGDEVKTEVGNQDCYRRWIHARGDAVLYTLSPVFPSQNDGFDCGKAFGVADAAPSLKRTARCERASGGTSN